MGVSLFFQNLFFEGKLNKPTVHKTEGEKKKKGDHTPIFYHSTQQGETKILGKGRERGGKEEKGVSKKKTTGEN